VCCSGSAASALAACADHDEGTANVTFDFFYAFTVLVAVWVFLEALCFFA